MIPKLYSSLTRYLLRCTHSEHSHRLLFIVVVVPMLIGFLGFGQTKNLESVYAQQEQPTPIPLMLQTPTTNLGEPGSDPVQIQIGADKPVRVNSEEEIWPWGRKNPEPKAVYNMYAGNNNNGGRIPQIVEPQPAPQDVVPQPTLQGVIPQPAPQVVIPQPTLQVVEPQPVPQGVNPQLIPTQPTSQPQQAQDISIHANPSASNMQAISQFGGAVFRVSVNGDYAYLGMQYRLAILNVSNPAAPALMGMTGTWPNSVLGVDVDDTAEHAYVAADQEGLRIIDVTNKRTPFEIGYYNNFPSEGRAFDVSLFGSRAFVADGRGGLQIVDISNPKAPVRKGCFATAGAAMDVDVFTRTSNGITKTYAALAVANDPNNPRTGDTNGIVIVDVSNPDCGCPCPSNTNPTCPIQTSFLATDGRAVAIIISGNYAYIADDEKGLKIIDITDVANPKLAGAYDTPQHAYSVSVSQKDNVAYIADGNQDVIAVDISDPTKPVYKGSFGCCDVEGDCFANDIALDGSYAFVVDPAYGLRVLNIANPAKMSQIYVFNSPAYTYGVQYQGYAYVTAGSAGLRVIEFPNYNTPPTPNYTDPREVGFFDTPGYAYAVQISWPYAYVADGERGLRIVNVSNPVAPHEVSFYDTKGEARDVALYNGFAYVADLGQGVRVIDVRNPENPVEVPAPPFNTGCLDSRAVYAADGYIYVADGTCGLRMFEAAAPEHNITLETLGTALDVSVAGMYAYVASGSGGGLQVIRIDISNTTNPATLTLTPVGSYDTDGTASAVDVIGMTAFLADGRNGVRMFDVTDPANPRETGFYDTRGSAGNLRVILNAIFVADGDGGLQILAVPLSNVTSKISGTVTLNGSGLTGVTITATAAGSSPFTTNSGASGNYEIANLPQKTYTVVPSMIGYTFSPASILVSVPPDATTKNFTAVANCLTGTIVDIKGRSIADVTVTITGTANYTIYTDANGKYSLCSVVEGTYKITPAKSNYTFYKSSESITVPPAPIIKDFVGSLPTSSPSGVIIDTQPTYVWDVVIGATRYHLLINGPSGNVVDQWYESAQVCSSDLCMARPGVTLVLGKYSWQIQTYSMGGTTTGFATQKSFEVVPIGVAILQSPARAISDKKPTFIWNPVAGVVKYHLMVLGNGGATMDAWYDANIICPITNCSVKSEVELTSGKYTWRVQTWNAAAEGPWSESLEFSIQ